MECEELSKTENGLTGPGATLNGYLTANKVRPHKNANMYECWSTDEINNGREGKGQAMGGSLGGQKRALRPAVYQGRSHKKALRSSVFRWRWRLIRIRN